MVNIAQSKERQIGIEQINSISCPNLQKIDKLWVNADKRFGFSVQKEIWIKTGKRLGIKPEDWYKPENYLQFARAVGWYDDKQEDTTDRSRGWLRRELLIGRIKEESVYGKGGLPSNYEYLPTTLHPDYIPTLGDLFSRIETCKL